MREAEGVAVMVVVMVVVVVSLVVMVGEMVVVVVMVVVQSCVARSRCNQYPERRLSTPNQGRRPHRRCCGRLSRNRHRMIRCSIPCICPSCCRQSRICRNTN